MLFILMFQTRDAAAALFEVIGCGISTSERPFLMPDNYAVLYSVICIVLRICDGILESLLFAIKGQGRVPFIRN